MKRWTYLNVPDHEIIADKVYSIIQETGIPNASDFYYLDKEARGESDRFKNIPEIVRVFKDLGLYDVWHETAIIVSYGNLGIHRDYGRSYSLNFPVRNTKNTFTKFYQVNSEPKVDTYQPDATDQVRYNPKYFKFDLADCEELESFELTQPALFHGFVPHGVTNLSPTAPRIIISCCLITDFIDMDAYHNRFLAGQ